MHVKVHKTNRALYLMQKKTQSKNILRHVTIELSKIIDKERILKAAKEKKKTYKGTPIRISADFSEETLQVRREWNNLQSVEK